MREKGWDNKGAEEVGSHGRDEEQKEAQGPAAMGREELSCWRSRRCNLERSRGRKGKICRGAMDRDAMGC